MSYLAIENKPISRNHDLSSHKNDDLLNRSWNPSVFQRQTRICFLSSMEFNSTAHIAKTKTNSSYISRTVHSVHTTIIPNMQNMLTIYEYMLDCFNFLFVKNATIIRVLIRPCNIFDSSTIIRVLIRPCNIFDSSTIISSNQAM